jgi:peptide/nickel transport system permease protein
MTVRQHHDGKEAAKIASQASETRVTHGAGVRRRQVSSAGVMTAVSAMILGVLAIGAVWPVDALPYDPRAVNLADRFVPMGEEGRAGTRYALGTDALGRDLLSRLLYAGRFTLLIAVGAAIVTTIAAIGFGVTAGYLGGAYESIVMRAVDALLSLPVILLAVALAAILGRGVGTLITILAFTGWADYTRVIRADALALRERPFIESSRALGSSALRVIVRHLLPNLVSTTTVMSTYLVARFILLESSISFLGMGIAPPATSWGAMIGEARQYIFQAPWVSVLPGLVITVTILAVNFLGDALRDRFDPATRT